MDTRKTLRRYRSKSAAWKHIILPGVALLALAADQLTKWWVITHMQPGESWNPIPFLRPWVAVTYVTNTGVAFGLFPAGGSLFVGVALLAIVGVLACYTRLSLNHWMVEVSLGLILGGAVGNNLIDRLIHGHVIDFIDFKIWPVFNLADSSICVAMVILIYYLWREQ